MPTKPAVSTIGMSAEQKQDVENGVNQGYRHSRRSEPVVRLDRGGNEVIVCESENNVHIVATTDRPRIKGSGYGMDTQAGSLDIVVGRMAHGPMDGMLRDPSFKTDAARIYVSMKTDADENFNLHAGKVGNSIAKSCIGIQADAVRISANEGIKLVTNAWGQNSHGQRVSSVPNIDFIAGNDGSKLEPLVKGYALARSLEKIVIQLSNTTETLNAFLQYQLSFNAAVTTHHHEVACVGGGVAIPSIECATAGALSALSLGARTAPSAVISMINAFGWRNNCLLPSGGDYILSENVHTT